MTGSRWGRLLSKGNEDDGGGAVLRGEQREKKREKRKEREIKGGKRNLILH